MRIIIFAGGKEEYIIIKRVLPTNDLAFRKAFAPPGNEDILQGIIGDFFEIRPALLDITITVPYSIESYKDVFKPEDGVEVWAAKLRETVRDISADINSADFGAELQIRKETFFTERSLHYTLR